MSIPALPSLTHCPVARAVDVVGDRWSLLVVRDAFDGVRRYSDFQRSLGVARNILSDRLRRLVEAGILAQQPASDGSAFQEYVLTAQGESLFPVVVALRQWAERHRYEPGEAHSQLVEARNGRPLPYMVPRGAAGAVLSPHATQVRKV
ncbi:Transcriptional regulator, HxlR family [plant metagenome]|uniref:Transcriptional regulator, HxlR family n=1 Tax=plant metagenome TaxID=1297885 RepID=A0A484VD87_9ZZZZ